MAKFLPRRVLYLGKAIFTVFLLWWLFQKLDIAAALDKLWITPANALISAIILILLSSLLTFSRWSVILTFVGSPVSMRTLTRYGFISVFFGQALPSSVGGDGMRIWLLYRGGVTPSVSFRSVLIDRAMGFLSLLALSLYGLPRLLNMKFGISVTTFSAALIALTATGLVVLLSIRRLAPLLNRVRIGRLLVQIVMDLIMLTRDFKALFGIVALSIVNQLVVCGAVWVLIRNLDTGASFDNVLIATPVIFILLIVPISIAGWGLRESLFVLCFGIVGVSQESAIVSSVLFGVVSMVASLPGALLWVLDAGEKSPQVPSA